MSNKPCNSKDGCLQKPPSDCVIYSGSYLQKLGIMPSMTLTQILKIINDFSTSGQNLQQTTTLGNTSTNSIGITGNNMGPDSTQGMWFSWNASNGQSYLYAFTSGGASGILNITSSYINAAGTTVDGKTEAPSENSTKLASTAWVNNKFATISIGLSAPSVFTVTGSPVNGSGTLGLTFAGGQTANQVLATPNGSAGPLGLRALVAQDIPNIDATKITTGILPIARGGTNTGVIGSVGQLPRVNALATALEYFTPNYLTANQTITLSGDVTGSGATAISTTISDSAVTYNKIQDTVAKRLIGRYSPSTGIVQEISLDPSLTLSDGGVLSVTGGGSVTSVGMTLPSELFSVSGSPVTSTGTLTGTFVTKAANLVFAGPISGAADEPTFRLLDEDDIPNLTAYALKSLTILPSGSGIQGGGDLSANRTFNLDFSYLDDRYLSGYKQRGAVRVATTGNITLSGTQTIDGVGVIVGNRVLVKNQSAPEDNGIYIVAAGTWTRATDFDQAVPGEIEQGSQIFVEEGTAQAKTGWSLSTPDPITVGTTPLAFIQYAGANNYTAGTGLNLIGNTFLAQTTTALWNALQLRGVNINAAAPSTGNLLRYNGTDWAPYAFTKTDIGLGNVDNTTDLNKPISTATQTALNGKVGTTRNITIAGTAPISSSAGAQNLSADRTWTLSLNDNGVTYAKMQDVTASRLLGRYAATNGDPQEITVGTGLTLSTGGTLTATGSGGTVSSVGLSLPAIFSVSGSPVTTTGTLTAVLAAQSPNVVFAGPSAGGAAAPTFRALTPSDIPTLTASKISDFVANARTSISSGTGISYNNSTGVITNSSPDQTVVLTPGTGIAVGGTYPNFTITNSAPNVTQNLSSVLTVGNTATNNIVLGASGNTTGYNYQLRRSLNSVNYTGSIGLGIDQTALTFVMSDDANGTVNRVLYLPALGTAPLFSPDSGVSKYTLWHSNNHLAGIANSQGGGLTGATVYSNVVTNSAGHLTSVSTRSLTAADISAAPASGSGNYIQNTGTVQASSQFHISGTGRSATNLQVNNGTVNVQMLINGAVSAQVGTASNHPLDIFTNGTTKARIESGGNFIIGTNTAAGAKLDVRGDIVASQTPTLGAGRTYVQYTTGGGYIQGQSHNGSSWIQGEMTVDSRTTFTDDVVISGQIQIDGGSPGVGKVLTSDAFGLGSWVTPAAGQIASVTVTDGSYTTFDPAWGNYVRITPTSSGSITLSSSSVYPGYSNKVAFVFNASNFTYNMGGTTGITSKCAILLWNAAGSFVGVIFL